MGSCLAQVSKKRHSTILNCFEANLTTTFWATITWGNPHLWIQSCQGQARGFLCPANPFFFLLQCRSNPELQHQLGPAGPKGAKKLTESSELPQMELPPPTWYQNCFVSSYLPGFLFQGKGSAEQGFSAVLSLSFNPCSAMEVTILRRGFSIFLF